MVRKCEMEDLPPELWDFIFSYLDFRGLCNARAVCKKWWELINRDHLWIPLVLKRGISERFLSGYNGNCNKVLDNCKTAEMCFSYYERVLSNWAKQRCKIVDAPYSTDTTEIHLPYMVRVFEAPEKNYVEILELQKGDFIPFDKIDLPVDPTSEVCYDLTMNKNNVFVVYQSNHSIIYKFSDGKFRFETALFFLGHGRFVSCSDESDLQRCFQLHSSNKQIFAVAVSEDVIWMYWLYPPFVLRAIYAWNYEKSELILTQTSQFFPDPLPLLSTSAQYISWFLDSKFLIFTLDGTMLFHHETWDIFQVDWAQSGCGFVASNGGRKAFYVSLDFPNPTPISLDVDNPLSIVIHGTNKLAYCLCQQGSNGTIACASTLTGELLRNYLWLPPIQNHTTLKIHVIHGKYILIHGLSGHSEPIFSKTCMSLYSALDGQLMWSHNFVPTGNDDASFSVHHIIDHFIMTVGEEIDGVNYPHTHQDQGGAVNAQNIEIEHGEVAEDNHEEDDHQPSRRIRIYNFLLDDHHL